MAKPVNLPPTVGATVDAIFKARARKAALDLKANTEAATIAELERHAMQLMTVQGLESGRGKFAQATRSETDHPTIADWDAFAKYVVRTRQLDLLHRRVSSAAWRERIEAGKKVPGISTFTRVTLHVTKVGRGRPRSREA